MFRTPWICSCAVCFAVEMSSAAMAVDVRVTITNLSAADSVAFSPFVLAAHDGTYDMFDTGSAASLGIENVAELGNGTDLTSEIGADQPAAVSDTAIATVGGFGPGIFPPGASGSIVLSLDPSIHRYLSYAAMVVPSNDAFLGNDSPTAVELFDAGENFVASDFMIVGSDIWDAGTEVNQLEGAAYVDGQDATMGDDENGLIHSANLGTQFSSYIGEMTPAGATFMSAPGAGTAVASFSFEVVPEPSAIALVGIALCGLIATRKRRRSR